jgi:hypothetical protein
MSVGTVAFRRGDGRLQSSLPPGTRRLAAPAQHSARKTRPLRRSSTPERTPRRVGRPPTHMVRAR